MNDGIMFFIAQKRTRRNRYVAIAVIPELGYTRTVTLVQHHPDRARHFMRCVRFQEVEEC